MNEGLPFIVVNESTASSSSVAADFQAKIDAEAQTTTVRLEYVAAANYEPGAPNPYANGVATIFEVTGSVTEVRQHLALAPSTVYHFRIVATNPSGSVETPDATVETYPAIRRPLPDDRAYEQASPVAKAGNDAEGRASTVTMSASPLEGGFTYSATAPFPGAATSSGETVKQAPIYLSSRFESAGQAGWITQGLEPPSIPAAEPPTLAGLTEDLSKAVVVSEEPLLAPGAVPGTGNAYIRDNTTGTYSLLAPALGTKRLDLASNSADDSRLLFETEVQLLTSAAAGQCNLYEYSERPLDAAQSLFVDATGGTFTLTFAGQSTAALPYNASVVEVQSALQALSTVGAGNVSVSGGPGGAGAEHPYQIGFTGGLAAREEPAIVADGAALTGSAQTATVTTVANGHLALAGVLPTGHAPAEGASAGPGGPVVGYPKKGGSEGGVEFYTEHTISTDGSRIFFSDDGTSRIYERLLSPEPAVTVPISAGPADYLAAPPDGRYVFYTEGSELYRFDAMTGSSEKLTSGAKSIFGTVLGVSNDGSYAYFVAHGVLVENENTNGEKAVEGAANLYGWHLPSGGSPDLTFIAKLRTAKEGGGREDESNWAERLTGAAGPSGHFQIVHVSADGGELVFSSERQLTAYHNDGHSEIYRYDAGTSQLVCVSCNPAGTPAVSKADFVSEVKNTENAGGKPISPARPYRNLSANGNRVFFETAESLLPGDINGTWDVYEWEGTGEGSCEASSVTFSPASGGCLFLISSGTSAAPSDFGDASENGDDVFFFTRQPLVGQDSDESVDVYDARVGGGIPSQNPPKPPPPCSGEGSCRGPAEAAPVFGAPAGLALAGGGDLSPPTVIVPPMKKPVPTVKCTKGKKLIHKKCVKVKIKKKKKSVRSGKSVSRGFGK